MSKVRLFILFLILPSLIFAKKLADLPEVMKTPVVHVNGDRMFISEGKTIHIYSLKDFKHLKQFLKVGAGPGEIRMYARLNVFPGKLVVNDYGKLIIFSHDGKLLEEFKLKTEIDEAYPVGPNFIGCIYHRGDQTINVYNRKFNIIKKIYEGSSGHILYVESGPKKMDIMKIRDYVAPYVYKDRIYIGDTSKGFYFVVFDSTGKKCYEVNREYQRLKVTEEHKRKIMRRTREESRNWEMTKRRFNFLFPEFFPAYRTLRISDDKIYFITYKTIDKSIEVIVTDLEGNFLRKTLIPIATEVYELFCITGDKVYYPIENEDEEMWELHVEDLKRKKFD